MSSPMRIEKPAEAVRLRATVPAGWSTAAEFRRPSLADAERRLSNDINLVAAESMDIASGEPSDVAVDPVVGFIAARRVPGANTCELE